MMPIGFPLVGMAGPNEDIFFKVPPDELNCHWQASLGKPGGHGQGWTSRQVEWRGKSQQGRQLAGVLFSQGDPGSM